MQFIQAFLHKTLILQRLIRDILYATLPKEKITPQTKGIFGGGG